MLAAAAVSTAVSSVTSHMMSLSAPNLSCIGEPLALGQRFCRVELGRVAEALKGAFFLGPEKLEERFSQLPV